MLGDVQYFPYFAHTGWLITKFLGYAISYEGIELFGFVVGRETTYTIYALIITAPLLLSSDRDVKIFSVLVTIVLATTYAFFRYAYISVFCFGGSLMSFCLAYMIFKKDRRRTEIACVVSPSAR